MASIFAYSVLIQKYGVVSFNNKMEPLKLKKSQNPSTNFAVVGLYFYPNDVVSISKTVKPSERVN